jgi:hypothetical protein
LKLSLFDAVLLLAVALILVGVGGGAYYGIKHPPAVPAEPILDSNCRLSEKVDFADIYECDRGDRQCTVVLSHSNGSVAVSCTYR